MGARLQGSDGDGGDAISEINVTPFVDVVLVLLVIFMVTAPLMLQSTLNLELPKASTSDAKQPRTLGVVVTRLGQILIDGVASTPEELTEKARATMKEDPNTQAVLSADKESRHEDLVRAIDALKIGGLNRFALEVRKEES